MITTEPLPRSAIGGIASEHSQMLLLTLLPMILSKASSLMSSSGIDRRVADQDVDPAVMFGCARNQRLDFLAARDVAGDDVGVAARLADGFRDFLAGVSLAAGDH